MKAKNYLKAKQQRFIQFFQKKPKRKNQISDFKKISLLIMYNMVENDHMILIGIIIALVGRKYAAAPGFP